MKNKSIAVFILSSLVVLGCGNDMTNTGGEGSGQTSCNISIANYKAFDKIRENLSCNYTLTADIDFEMRTDFEPIGTKDKPFTGVLDGSGHTIKNVKIENSDTDYVGVIGYAKGATIKKFVVENANVKGKRVGAVVGEVHDSKIMELSVIGGTVEGSSYSTVGGLVATIVDSAIENSYSTASATYTGTPPEGTEINIGGLVGYKSSYSSIKNSYATGAVTVTGTPPEGTEINIGGLVGKNYYSNKVSNSYYDKEGTKQTDIGKGIGVSGKANIVKRDNKYYDTLGTEDITTDDVEIFKGWDFANVWVFTERQWPKLAWQTN